MDDLKLQLSFNIILFQSFYWQSKGYQIMWILWKLQAYINVFHYNLLQERICSTEKIIHESPKSSGITTAIIQLVKTSFLKHSDK